MELWLMIMIITAILALLGILATWTSYTIDRIEKEKDGQPYKHWRELL
jgi:hypothetical protein